MKVSHEAMRLYIVTDRSWLDGNSLYEQVDFILKSGATFLQLREKDMAYDAFLQEAIEMKKLTDQTGIPFVINDNVDICMACGADGVHIGQKDRRAAEVRRQIGAGKILGVSAQTVEQALQAEKDGADYLGVGAVFGTTTKADAQNVSHQTLKEICSAVSIPVVAIGGIHENNLMELSGTGVDGVAVISAVFAKPDVGAAARLLRERAEQMAAGATK